MNTATTIDRVIRRDRRDYRTGRERSDRSLGLLSPHDCDRPRAATVTAQRVLRSTTPSPGRPVNTSRCKRPSQASSLGVRNTSA